MARCAAYTPQDMPRKRLLASILLVPMALLAAVVAGNGGRAQRRSYAVQVALPPPGEPALAVPIIGPADAGRPLVVIDAGHGGHDPGAQQDGRQEKDLTLLLAQALAARLVDGGGIRVALTRADDRFVLLPQRSAIARRLKAALFISIHADSSPDRSAAGATLYTLSPRGSSQAAQQLADSENSSDRIAGIGPARNEPAVAAILVDLAQRHTQRQSEEFAALVLRDGRGHMAFRQAALQSAGFVVLKSPDVPSVLFEAGYISNPADAAWLASAAGRAAFAQITDRAIRVYFARQSAPLASVPP